MSRVLPLILLLAGCAHSKALSTQHGQEPNLDGVVQLIGRFGIASACPFGDGRYALTAAHVVDVRPFDQGVPLYGARWSDGYGGSGLAEPVFVFLESDLAVIMRADGKPWEHPYQLAQSAPEPDARVYIRGYDKSGKRKAFGPKTTRGKVLRRVADNLILDEDSLTGSSGGCVLNEAGEILSTVAWGPDMPDGPVGISPGVWASAEYFWESYRQGLDRMAEAKKLLESMR
jgi:trypsin-like peptidase